MLPSLEPSVVLPSGLRSHRGTSTHAGELREGGSLSRPRRRVTIGQQLLVRSALPFLLQEPRTHPRECMQRHAK